MDAFRDVRLHIEYDKCAEFRQLFLGKVILTEEGKQMQAARPGFGIGSTSYVRVVGYTPAAL